MGRRPMTEAMLDEWRMLVAALELDLVDAARGMADRLIERTGWERYALAGGFNGDELYLSGLMPPMWAYLARVEGERRLLVNLRLVTMLQDYLSWDALMGLAEESGPGLVRLDSLMADLVVTAVTVPDDASGL